jgi:hypothetical protein
LAKSYTLQGVVSKCHPPSIAGNNFSKFISLYSNKFAKFVKISDYPIGKGK